MLQCLVQEVSIAFFAMSKIAKLVDAVNSAAKSGGAVYQFDISDVPNGKFVVDLKNGNPCAYIGEDAKADVTVTIAEADVKALAEKKLDPMQAFMGGKLKVKGNMMLLMKLQDLLQAAA